MKQNETQLKLDQQRRLGEKIRQVTAEIEKYTKLIALVAPTTFSHKAAHAVPIVESH